MVWDIKADFEGQRRAEALMHWILTAFGAVGFTVGFVQQSASPPWPIYRSHPVEWLPKRERPVQESEPEQKTWWTFFKKILF
ncbi:hypothetical protein BC829DRAFT_386853 [Chytridium lagenaria]|nr:hypothetical protein BC829DRAFT_386853 [Chytridium lagenaria]